MPGAYFTHIKFHYIWLCSRWYWWTLVRRNNLDELRLKCLVQRCDEEVQFKSNLYNHVGDCHQVDSWLPHWKICLVESDVLDLLRDLQGKILLGLCRTSAQVVTGFFISASCVTFRQWKTGGCMYSDTIYIRLLPNNWAKIGAIKIRKEKVQCLVNERTWIGWITAMQSRYEVVLKPKVSIILYTIFNSKGR